MLETLKVVHFEGAGHVASMADLEAVLAKRYRDGAVNHFMISILVLFRTKAMWTGTIPMGSAHST